jgi:hypothetical protein
MAFVDQAKKSRIAANLKKVVPAGWKYSLAVRNHSTIVMTIASAPFELIKAFKASDYFKPETATHMDVNPYHYAEWIEDECVAEVISKIMGALNTDNFDKSDSMTDYFYCGHYVDLNIGRWNKPFVCTAKPVELGVAA